MTPLELWALIQATPQCAAHIVPNAPKAEAAAARAGDQAIADILNAAGAGAGTQAVPVWEAKKTLIKRGRWRNIVLAAQDARHPAVEPAYAAVALAEDARMTADFLDPSATAHLAALVAGGLIDESDKAALETLSRAPSAISAEQVSRAVRGPRE